MVDETVDHRAHTFGALELLREAPRRRDVFATPACVNADTAKRALVERGAMWWTDGVPARHRYLDVDSSYAARLRALDWTAVRSVEHGQ